VWLSEHLVSIASVVHANSAINLSEMGGLVKPSEVMPNRTLRRVRSGWWWRSVDGYRGEATVWGQHAVGVEEAGLKNELLANCV
jgi:hypothetical protein